MTASQALVYGIIVSGPLLLIGGTFFAFAITVSQFHHLLGKAIAWPLAPVCGLTLGAPLARVFLPNWGDWGVGWFFGVGFFAAWMVVGLLSHDDLTYRYPGWINSLASSIIRKVKNKSIKSGSTKKVYKATAATRQTDQNS